MTDRKADVGRLGQRVRELRKRLGSTQEDLADKAGIERSYVGHIETGRTKMPSREVFRALARALEVDVSDLVHAAGLADIPPEAQPPKTYAATLRELEERAPVEIPVYDQIIHAGGGAIAQEYVYLPPREARNRNLAAAHVKGDCMEPTIGEGDLIIVDLDASPAPGDVVVVLVDREEMEVKRLTRKINGKVVLSCDNPAFSDVEVNHAQIQGVVIQVTKRLRG